MVLPITIHNWLGKINIMSDSPEIDPLSQLRSLFGQLPPTTTVSTLQIACSAGEVPFTEDPQADIYASIHQIIRQLPEPTRSLLAASLYQARFDLTGNLKQPIRHVSLQGLSRMGPDDVCYEYGLNDFQLDILTQATQGLVFVTE